MYNSCFYIGKGIIRNNESVVRAQQPLLSAHASDRGRSGLGLIPAHLSDHIEKVGGTLGSKQFMITFIKNKNIIFKLIDSLLALDGQIIQFFKQQRNFLAFTDNVNYSQF